MFHYLALSILLERIENVSAWCTETFLHKHQVKNYDSSLLICVHQASWLMIWWATRTTASRRSTWAYASSQARVSAIGDSTSLWCHMMNLHVLYFTSPAQPTSIDPCAHSPRLSPWVCQNTRWPPALCANVAWRWYQVCHWARLLRGRSLSTWESHTERLMKETGNRTRLRFI